MSVFAWILLFGVSAFALYEIGTLIYAIVKKQQEKKKLRKENVKSNEDNTK